MVDLELRDHDEAGTRLGLVRDLPDGIGMGIRIGDQVSLPAGYEGGPGVYRVLNRWVSISKSLTWVVLGVEEVR